MKKISGRIISIISTIRVYHHVLNFFLKNILKEVVGIQTKAPSEVMSLHSVGYLLSMVDSVQRELCLKICSNFSREWTG